MIFHSLIWAIACNIPTVTNSRHQHSRIQVKTRLSASEGERPDVGEYGIQRIDVEVCPDESPSTELQPSVLSNDRLAGVDVVQRIGIDQLRVVYSSERVRQQDLIIGGGDGNESGAGSVSGADNDQTFVPHRAIRPDDLP